VLVWLVLLALAACLAHCQLAGRGHWMLRYFPEPDVYNSYQGWPLVFSFREPGEGLFEFHLVRHFRLPLSIDVGISLFILAVTGWLLHHLFVRPVRVQWRVSSLFVLTALVAVVLASLQIEAARIRSRPLGDPWEQHALRYSPILWLNPAARAGLLACLAATFYTAGLVVVRLARRILGYG
jgi:hypothetical protein